MSRRRTSTRLFEAWLEGRWVLFDRPAWRRWSGWCSSAPGATPRMWLATIFGQPRMTRKEVKVLEHDPRPRRVLAPTAPVLPATLA